MKTAVHSSKAKNGEPIMKSSEKETERPARFGPYDAMLGIQRAIGNQAFAKLLASAANSSQTMPSLPRQRNSAKQTSGVILQRKCACGGTPGPAGECEECRRKRLQRKLSIGLSNDPLESEADRLAEQALAGHRRSNVTPARNHVQRASGPLDEIDASEAGVEQILSSSGSELEPPVKNDMERRFGHDFSRVRVHADGKASESARKLSALAYTAGHHIVFAAGRYDPRHSEGKRLLSHELVHVMQQQGSNRGIVQRDINPACAPILARNKGDQVCKEPPSATKVGNAAHRRIQAGFVRPPDNLVELPIPGAGNVCSESRFEPEFSRGKADLVRVVSREKAVQVELGEIKPLNNSGLSLGPSQLACYQRHLTDVGTLCKSMTPEGAEKAKKHPTDKLAAEMCLRLGAVGKSVKATKEGVFVPAQRFELFGRQMVALTCFPGVVGYSCLDPEQESRPDPKDAAGLAIAGPGGAAAAGFVVGFLAGAKRTIPEETWTKLYETLSQPLNQGKFQAGLLVGRPLGMVASLEDLLKGLAELLKLGLEFSAVGVVGTELYARFKGEESPTLRRARMAKDLAQGLPQFVEEVKKNPGLFFDTGEDIGNLCGEEAGRRFLKEFVSADPFVMGMIVGKVQGYLAVEIAMLLVGAEEITAVGKGISAAARTAKASRFGAKILEVLDKIPALKRLLDALRGAKRVRVAAELTEATAASDALKARDAAKAADRARALEALEHPIEEEQAAKKVMRR